MPCNCGKNKRQTPTAIPHQTPPSQQGGASTGPDRRGEGKRRRFSVVGGTERATFGSLGEARAWQRSRGGRLR